MKILDTNGVTYIFDNSIILQDDYFLVPDVAEEVELTQLVHGKQIPKRVLEIADTDVFDRSLYIGHYKSVLNKYGGRSFYNMTGFGDVSVLATLHTIMDVFDLRSKTQLFGFTEPIVVYTGDARLTKNINTDFAGKNITVLPQSDIS